MTSHIKTKNLPHNPGVTGWNAILPQDKPAQALDKNMLADWLIIGGGFAGLSAARRLSQLCPGSKIAVLEAGRIGDGPAGRNSGFMIDLPHVLSSEDYAGDSSEDRLQIQMNRRAIAFALDAADEYGLDSEIVSQTGKVNGAATTKGVAHNLAYAGHLENLGEACEILDAKQMQKLCGSDYYHQGLYTPGTTMLHPAAYVRGLRNGLQNKVSIFENSPVTSLTRTGADWQAKTPTGTITTPHIIMAVNGHAQSFGFFKRRFMHIFLYASMTRALNTDEVQRLGGMPRWGITPSDPLGSTIRRISGRSGDRIIVRNQASFVSSMEVPDHVAIAKRKHHDRSFTARFANIGNIDMEYSWGGKLCLSLNDVPAFGAIEDGITAACCQNGLGTARGTLSGIVAADLVTGNLQDNQQSLQRMLSYPEPKKLPIEPFATIGATLTIKYREWRAGKEV
ncbi:MAG: NAD(P)/FAD-dependent oxidoreductase [Candidatus Puniceispirillum sp.]